MDTTNIDKSKIDYFLSETANLANILAASLLTLKGKRKSGSQKSE